MASKYTYLVEAGGCLCVSTFTSKRDAIAEAKYRVRVFHESNVRVIRVGKQDIVWKVER